VEVIPVDSDRFDILTRSLTRAGSRRRALSGVLLGSLGLLGWQGGAGVGAHDLKDKCKKKSGEAKKKCLKKAKKHNRQHADETALVTCSPSCAGKQCGDNGCGGSCGACGNPCTECRGGLCVAKAQGTACGTATAPAQCIAGRCALECGPACLATCNACASTTAPQAGFCADEPAAGCGGLTKPCLNHDDCEANELCRATSCPAIEGTTNRCQTLCET
jgi:hypothetical protein